MMMSEFPEKFTELWWMNVVNAWNQYPYAVKLANLGTAVFEVQESNYPCIVVRWNKYGKGEIIEEIKGKHTIFSASFESWQAFINGEFSAAEGVLKGKIRLSVSPLSILPYAQGFTQLAQVAKSVTNTYELQ